jgi:NAD(P)-dependent dehydrogenase (short-subunit alcohol dehydrogenase family)
LLARDKVAVVTGAGRGIGREIALTLAREGGRVMVNDKGTGVESSEGRDASVAEAVAEEIRAAGGDARSSSADVTDADAVAAMIAGAREAWGRVDILVHAAGIIRDRMVWNVPPEEWDDVMSVHLKGCYTTTRAFAQDLREHRERTDEASIVTFSSSAGVYGNVGSSAYGAAKAGVIGFSRIVAMELARYGARVNCIVPFAWTRMSGQLPGGSDDADRRVERLKELSPAHVANLAAFLASDGAEGITGQVLGMRGKELLVFAQPSIHAQLLLADSSPQSIAEAIAPRLKHHLPALRQSPEIFDYEPHT